MKTGFICTCENIEANTYGNQIFVHAPAHMPKANGYCLDKCIAEEVMVLWQLGITTTGCCCGHGKAEPFIGVAFEEISRMKSLGYQTQYNRSRPVDEDSFIPMGSDYALAILLKTVSATDTE